MQDLTNINELSKARLAGGLGPLLGGANLVTVIPVACLALLSCSTWTQRGEIREKCIAYYQGWCLHCFKAIAGP